MFRSAETSAFSIRGADVVLPDVEVSTFKVHEGSVLASRTLAALDLRHRYRVTVLALRRGETTTANPTGTETIGIGDVLVVMGTVSALAELAPLFKPEEDGVS